MGSEWASVLDPFKDNDFYNSNEVFLHDANLFVPLYLDRFIKAMQINHWYIFGISFRVLKYQSIKSHLTINLTKDSGNEI